MEKAVENSANDLFDVLFQVILATPHIFYLIPNAWVEIAASIRRWK